MVITRSWLIIILIMSVFLIYLPGLPGGFLFDDFWNILENSAVTDPELSFKAIMAVLFSGESGPLGRPLSMLSFYLNYQFSGISPLGFKLVNIAIHALNSVLVFLIVRRLYIALCGVSSLVSKREYQLPAFLVALFWAVHPINLTTILYVVQRMNGLSALFVLMGVLLYLKLRQKESISNTSFVFGLIGVVLCGVLAALFKENGVLLFLYLFLIECLAFNWCTDSRARKNLLLIFYILVLLLPIIGGLIFFSDRIFDGYELRPYNVIERLLTQSRVIWFYIYQIFLPQVDSFGLYHDDFKISYGLLNPVNTFISIIGLVILIIAAIRIRRISPVFSFGILWFFCGHMMESTVLALDMVYEHRNYLPSIGLVMIIVGIVEQLFNKGYVVSSKFLGGVLLVLFILITVQRAYDWRDPIVLAERTAQHHPNSVKAQYDVGYNYLKLFEITGDQQYVEKGVGALKKAMAVSTTETLPFLAMLYMDVSNNVPVDDEFLQDIYSRLRKTPVAQPELVTVTKLIECELEKRCHLSEKVVLEIFDSLFANKYLLDESKDSMLETYGVYLYSLPEKQLEAVKVLRDVARRHPDILQYQTNLADVLMGIGEKEEATILMDSLKGRFGIEWKIQKD